MKIQTMLYTMKKGGSYDRFRMMLEALLERRCEIHCLSLTPIVIHHPLYYNHVVLFPSRNKGGVVAKCFTVLVFPFYGFLMGWREKIDLFVAFGPLYAFLESMPKVLLGKPMVTFIRLDLSLGSRGCGRLSATDFMNKAIEYIALAFSNRIIATNLGMRDEILKLSGRRSLEVKVLFNNIPPMKKLDRGERVEIRKELGIPEDGRILVTAGVLTPRKNFELLIRCLSRLGREDIFLVIVGDSNTLTSRYYRRFLTSLAKRLGVENKVVWPGWIEKEKLWKIFHASDLFVLPSLKEGMPNVLLEALGADLPCLGSDTPGIRDILGHEELMFDPHDDSSLVNKLSRYLSENQYSSDVFCLCQKRKEIFFFDWEEHLFLLTTQGILS